MSGKAPTHLNHGVRLGETLETLDELGQLGRVLALDGDAHDGADAELHHLHVVSRVEGGDRSGLDQVLIDADQTADVSARYILDGFDVATHHEDGALDALLEEILLLAGREVRSQDAHFLARLDFSGEDSAEGVEATLVRGGHHFGDVHHQWRFGIAFLHAWKRR